MNTPIRIHPKNPKIFEFRGKPRVLICATEHYGAVMNRPFDFERYLADAAEKGQTLTRLFTLFRELQSAVNPYSTCKPESPDYIAPFRRVGPKRALDGEPQYDLGQWNPEFFERLHRFLSLASDYGIVVEVVLLSNTYAEPVWALNPGTTSTVWRKSSAWTTTPSGVPTCFRHNYDIEFDPRKLALLREGAQPPATPRLPSRGQGRAGLRSRRRRGDGTCALRQSGQIEKSSSTWQRFLDVFR
ncbi:MAG: hypothetical protein HY360_25535 [Verrucomicrobia bacterium]|nr:hypothetical protein [Verrucomicrobiota bacterium]